jgi:hypothetical protein
MTAETKPTPRLRKTVRGKRPEFHENAAIDRLVHMVMTLASEVSTLRDRIDTMERLGSDAGWLKAGAVDAYRPPLEVRTVREKRREEYVQRLFAIMQEELDDIQGDETDTAYWAAVDAIEKGEAKPKAASKRKKS